MIPNIGPLELIIVAIVALMIFGPKRVPELGRSIGHGIREFKGSINGDEKDDEEVHHLEPAKAESKSESELAVARNH